MSTTRQRIDLLARAHPRLFPRKELRRLVHAQLGHLDALDGWIKLGNARMRARPPRLIYHVCAGNLAVSACSSLVTGLLLGADNVLKLPGDREAASTRREILEFIRQLPPALRQRVKTIRSGRAEILRRADAVIAFGSDATMENLRNQTRWNQKFIAHGHAVSLLWIEEPETITPRQARACAVDVLTYDQLGCLSPQAIYVPKSGDIRRLGDRLALALEAQWKKIQPKPRRTLGIAARIAEARDLAHALGHRVWLPTGRHPGWTLIHDPSPRFRPSPLHGVIYLRRISPDGLARALGPVSGRISTVGVAGNLSSRSEKAFLSLGVSRFCAAGAMQFPPLTWHHDGRPSLADLVDWVDAESGI